MPTIFRFFLICGVIAAALYAVVFTLANTLQPDSREITVVVPPAKYAK